MSVSWPRSVISRHLVGSKFSETWVGKESLLTGTTLVRFGQPTNFAWVGVGYRHRHGVLGCAHNFGNVRGRLGDYASENGDVYPPVALRNLCHLDDYFGGRARRGNAPHSHGPWLRRVGGRWRSNHRCNRHAVAGRGHQRDRKRVV